MTSSLLSVLPMNVFLPGAQLAQLLKNKMLLHATPNNLSGNRTINAEMQKNYNAVKDNVILKNLIASENLTALWDRLGVSTALTSLLSHSSHRKCLQNQC